MRLGRTGGREDCKSCNPRPWFHSPKSRSGTNTVVYVERKCSSSLVLFFLVVVTILSSVKKPPRSRWNQSAFLSYPSSVGEEFALGQRAREEGRRWNWTAGENDSVFSTWMFFICSLHSSCLPYLTHSVLPHPCTRQKLQERSFFPPSVLSIHPCWPNKEKKAQMNTNC